MVDRSSSTASVTSAHLLADHRRQLGPGVAAELFNGQLGNGSSSRLFDQRRHSYSVPATVSNAKTVIGCSVPRIGRGPSERPIAPTGSAPMRSISAANANTRHPVPRHRRAYWVAFVMIEGLRKAGCPTRSLARGEGGPSYEGSRRPPMRVCGFGLEGRRLKPLTTARPAQRRLRCVDSGRKGGV